MASKLAPKLGAANSPKASDSRGAARGCLGTVARAPYPAAVEQQNRPPQNSATNADAPASDSLAVERALRLARLGVESAEREPFAREFERVLASFAELRRIDVAGVAPLHTPSARIDALREDRSAPSLDRESLLANAPDAHDGFFGVPKTLGGEA